MRWRLVDLAAWVWDEFKLSVSRQTLGRERRCAPAHLPREEVMHEPATGTCACPSCGGTLRPLAPDSHEMLDVLPVSWRVVRHIRPKYSCRACERIVRELVLVDRSADKAEGEAMDLRHAVAVPMTSPIEITVGDYAEAARSSIVVLTAGVASGDPDASRLDLLNQNVKIIRDILGKLKTEDFAGILIVTSNPVDVLAKVAHEVSGLAPGSVIGSGTLIDTARLRGMIGDALGVEPRAVDAYVIGEHGDSEIAVWSGARVAGVPLDRFPGGSDLDRRELLKQVREAAPEIVARKGATEYAIGLCVKRICEAILRNERAALAVSTLLTGEYGVDDVYLGTPYIVGKNGVERVIELELEDVEREGVQASAALLIKARAELKD